jgi:hypothetical protein
VAGSETALVERVNQALMHGTMSPQLKRIIATAVDAVAANRLADRALNAVYLAAISSEYSVYTAGGGPATPSAPGVPAAPQNLSGTANRSNLSLRWANALDGPAPDSIVLDVAGPVTLSVPIALGDSFSYSGVPNGTYTFSVRAVNAAGSSPASNAVTLTFPGTATCTGAPLVPTSFYASRNRNVVSVSWQPPAGGPTPTRYIVSVGGAVAASFSTSGLSLSGVAPPGTYMLSVRAINACGESASAPSQTISVP